MLNNSFEVTVVRDEGTWSAVVDGVDGAQVWDDEFEGLETGIRAKLEELRGATDPDLVWHVDS